MELKILQTNNRKYAFMDYEWAIAYGFNLDDYKVVYEEETYDYRQHKVDGEQITITRFLDTIYTRFNLYRPENYKARSLSTSDIVVLGDKKYYCDSIGWKEIK